jgi:hypothetical protein
LNRVVRDERFAMSTLAELEARGHQGVLAQQEMQTRRKK